MRRTHVDFFKYGRIVYAVVILPCVGMTFDQSYSRFVCLNPLKVHWLHPCVLPAISFNKCIFLRIVFMFRMALMWNVPERFMHPGSHLFLHCLTAGRISVSPLDA